MVGKTLSHYEILGQLGAGGMGEVYLGEDTRLGRKVAIKVLPAEFASDPERRARFEQEARAAAALNHPHIAVVHDIGTEPDESGADTHFMVQEYLEGQSLGERLQKGALPLDGALGLAIEVGEALVAAHKAGITHRDLKPDNVFITEEGHAKVLDFGLAKLTEAAAPPGSDVSHSPTMLGTAAGQVMGTAGYMSPEQVNGLEVDNRADLFAFGCVLYEMVSGRRAFTGETLVQTLHRIAHEPHAPLEMSLPDAPFLLSFVVDKCLEKHPGRRYQSAGDLVVDLRKLMAEQETGVTTLRAPESRAQPSRALPALVLLGVWAVVATALAVWGLSARTPATPGAAVRFWFPAPENYRVVDLSLSPDGSLLAYTARDERGWTWLWLRDMRLGAVEKIDGTEGAMFPFWRPDSSALAFFKDQSLVRLDIDTRSMGTIAAAPHGRGGTWNLADEIVFAPSTFGGLYVVSADGESEPQPATSAGADVGSSDRFPQFLPDGRRYLFYRTESRELRAASVGSLESEHLTPSQTEALVVDGHLMFQRQRTLMIQPFDHESLLLSDEPLTLQTSMAPSPPGGNLLATVSAAGVLAYRRWRRPATRLVRIDRSGRSLGDIGEAAMRFSLDLSFDGRRLAFSRPDPSDGQEDTWVLELTSGGRERRVTSGWFPDWLDDSTIVNKGGGGITATRIDTADSTRQLVVDESRFEDGAGAPGGGIGIDVAASGDVIVFSGTAPDTVNDLWHLELPDGDPEPLVVVPGNQEFPEMSPQGEWVAYESDQSGRREILAVARSDKRTRVVSVDGGMTPHWSADGRELYYLSYDGKLMASAFDGSDFETAEALFDAPGEDYVVLRDGEGFLFAVPEGEDESQGITVVVNWFEELKRLAPTDGSR